MNNSFNFIVPGPPVGKERPRKGKHGFYTPKKTKDYESLIGWQAKSALAKQTLAHSEFKWNLHAKYIVIMRIYYQKITKRIPDIDNIIKSILDGMNKIVYDDDNLVRRLDVELIEDSLQNEVWVDVSYEA